MVLSICNCNICNTDLKALNNIKNIYNLNKQAGKSLDWVTENHSGYNIWYQQSSYIFTWHLYSLRTIRTLCRKIVSYTCGIGNLKAIIQSLSFFKSQYGRTYRGCQEHTYAYIECIFIEDLRCASQPGVSAWILVDPAILSIFFCLLLFLYSLYLFLFFWYFLDDVIVVVVILAP